MSDDTQDPRTEPGNENTDARHFVESVEPDVLPPLHVERSYEDIREPLAVPGHCVVGDGMSNVCCTRPNDEPPIGGEYRIRYERIKGICEQLDADPWKLERIETLLGIFVTDPSKRERIGVVAVQLSSRPALIENAEQLIAMGS